MNPVTIFVLWIFMAHPWSYGPFPMTSGWASTSVFWDRETCDLAVENGKFLNPDGQVLCLKPGELPPGPIAEQLPMDRSNQGNDKEEYRDKEELKELRGLRQLAPYF